LARVKETFMVEFYDSVCAEMKWAKDAAMVADLAKVASEKMAEFEKKISEAELQEGENELREAHLAKAEFLYHTGAKESTIAQLEKTMEKTIGLGQKLDIVFTKLRVGLFHLDKELVEANLKKAKELLEAGGDWEKRNKLKIYEGLYFMMIRSFKKAADLFLDSISTFSSYEVCSYNDFIFYTVLCSVCALNRVDLRNKVVAAPEILTVIREIPNLQEFLSSIYDCKYAPTARTPCGL